MAALGTGWRKDCGTATYNYAENMLATTDERSNATWYEHNNRNLRTAMIARICINDSLFHSIFAPLFTVNSPLLSQGMKARPFRREYPDRG